MDNINKTILKEIENNILKEYFKNDRVLNIKPLDIGGFIETVKIEIENKRKTFNKSILILFIEGRKNIKSILEVKNNLKNYSYLINGQPSKNTKQLIRRVI